MTHKELKKYRVNVLKMTAKEMAAALNVSTGSVSQWETGRGNFAKRIPQIKALETVKRLTTTTLTPATQAALVQSQQLVERKRQASRDEISEMQELSARFETLSLAAKLYLQRRFTAELSDSK